MKQHASTVFHRPPERLNCAQAVLDAFQTITGKHVAPVAEYKAFGGGRAPGGECGALYAACQAMPEAAADFRAAFSSRAGTTLCKELDALPCRECVAFAAELLERKQPGAPSATPHSA